MNSKWLLIMIVPRLTFLWYRKSCFDHTVLKCNGGILYPQPLVADKLNFKCNLKSLDRNLPFRKGGQTSTKQLLICHVISSFNTLFRWLIRLQSNHRQGQIVIENLVRILETNLTTFSYRKDRVGPNYRIY